MFRKHELFIRGGNMKRRQFLKGSLIGVAGLGVFGSVWINVPANTQALSIDAALSQIEALSKNIVLSSGAWSAGKVFAHCAQSIEFSMAGFPEHKSEFFKNTAGHLAFSVFSSKGKMQHSLSEDIPGAPDIAPDQDTLIGLERLKKAFIVFQQYTGELEPHFAYGALSKSDYEIAHVMHFYNHLEELSSKS